MNVQRINTWIVILATGTALGVLIAMSTAKVLAGDDKRGVPSVLMECATVSAGAETETNGTLVNVGQTVIGRASGVNLEASFGVIYCLRSHLPPGISCPNSCGDISGDGFVDLGDFAAFARCFGLTSPSDGCDAEQWSCSDLDGNGEVNLADFATFALLFGRPATGSPPNCL